VNRQTSRFKAPVGFWDSEEAALKLEEHLREVLLGCERKNLPHIQV